MPPTPPSRAREPRIDVSARRAFQLALDGLLDATGASRATLRLDWPQWGLQVDDVAAEARVPGVASLKGETSIDQRQAESVRWLERERRPLVQEDCSSAEHPPPPELVRLYGVKAQMLGPVVWARWLAGWVSVHENRGERGWLPEDIASLEQTVSDVLRVLSDHPQARGGSH
jgi:maleate isomerase